MRPGMIRGLKVFAATLDSVGTAVTLANGVFDLTKATKKAIKKRKTKKLENKQGEVPTC